LDVVLSPDLRYGWFEIYCFPFGGHEVERVMEDNMRAKRKSKLIF